MSKKPSLTIPEGELSPFKKSPPKVAAGHSLSSYPICPDDGFPMIKINGRLECCAEALNHCIGQRMVVDVVQRGRTTYYVFDDGHELPLLCGCCGQGLMVSDLEKIRKNIVRRRLEAMSIETRGFEEDDLEYEQLVLEFSKLGMFSEPLYISVAFEVAAQLRHPEGSPPGRRRVASEKKGRPRQKRGRKKR